MAPESLADLVIWIQRDNFSCLNIFCCLLNHWGAAKNDKNLKDLQLPNQMQWDILKYGVPAPIFSLHSFFFPSCSAKIDAKNDPDTAILHKKRSLGVCPI